MARTTLEMLGQAGLGYSLDDFQKDTSDHFRASLKDLLLTSHILSGRSLTETDI